jgi:hypothetical protein
MDSIVQALGIYAATLIVGVLSGLIPIVNGELFLIGIILATDDPPVALAVAVLMAIGQMIAKIVLYKAACKATDLARPVRREAAERPRAHREAEEQAAQHHVHLGDLRIAAVLYRDARRGHPEGPVHLVPLARDRRPPDPVHRARTHRHVRLTEIS